MNHIQRKPLDLLRWGIFISAFLTACWIMALRMGVGLDTPARTVFGDPGDGFFNLWILEHLRLNGLQGWNAISDGRILHPANGVFWWSDNLMALSPPYLAARAAGASIPTAGYLTSVFWISFQLPACMWLFSEVRKLFDSEGATDGKPVDPLIPCLALVATFTPARLWGLQHFQNHALVYWILCTGFTLRNLRTRGFGSLFGIGAAWLCLLASNPYYAILGLFPVSGWFLASLAYPQMDWKRLLTRQVPIMLPLALLATPLVLAYMGSEIPEHAEAELLRRAWRLRDLFPPALDRPHHGYPGLWLVLSWLGVGAALVWRWRGAVRQIMRRREVWVLTGFALITLIKAREIYPVTGWIRIGVQLGGVVLAIRLIRERGDLRVRGGLVLVFTLVLVTGTAMGPGRFFGGHAPDPSIYGMLVKVVPGYGGMRDLIRFAPVVAVIGGALVYAGLLTLIPRRARGAGCCILSVVFMLSLVETRGWTPSRREIDPRRLVLTPEQKGVFENLDGVMLVIPAAPFHRNPETMLQFQSCPSLRLVNGYSGRSTRNLDRIIRAELVFGRGSRQVMTAARNSDADWICLRTDWFLAEQVDHFARTYPVVYRDREFLVLTLPRMPNTL